MDLGAWSALEWLALIEHELLLFAGAFFLLGALDELAVDGIWMWLRARGKAVTHTINREDMRHRQLAGRAAVLIPAWQEAGVLGETVGRALASWKQRDLRIYVGVYRNDAASLEAAIRGAGGDPRLRLVVLERDGPSTKADCLNRLYRAVELDERPSGQAYRMMVLHDAEDIVDPAAIGLLDRAIEDHAFVQLPVLALPQSHSRWIGSHYTDEFAESHGKTMVVRDALASSIPAAGVGCAFSRDALARLAQQQGGNGPFSDQSLTEDYELGLRISENGGSSRFLRIRGENGELVATRAFFPDRIDVAVRQKTRWTHGIALQGWDRMGWGRGLAEFWMRLRDRRGPLAALVLFTGYALLAIFLLLGIFESVGFKRPWQPSPLLEMLLWANAASIVWRAIMRFTFTRREFGWREGVRAVLRIPVANIISIMSGWRALVAYAQTLRGAPTVWDKTYHEARPAPARDRVPRLETAR